MFHDLVEYHVYRGVERPISARAYDYILAGNGLFKRAHSRYVQARIPLVTVRVAGLPDLEPAIELNIWPGRGPGRLLYPILADARKHAQNGHEQMYHVRLIRTPDGLRWRVMVPGQRAGAGRIEYQVGDEANIVCDLHSHHRLGAFFSGTDDRDEVGFRFYAVVGRVLDRPEISLRLGMYGDFCYLPIVALFTNPGPFADRFHDDREKESNDG
jgi:PRTRC genetic system protein A